MDGYFRKTILLALLMALALGFPACNGKENGATTNKHPVEGKVLKGAVQNATVKIYTLNAQKYRDKLIGNGTTGPDGSFNAQADDTAGPLVLIVASGGDYVDEATGQLVSIPSWWELSALTPWPSDYTKVNLTPLTRMATEQALNRIAAGESPLTALENAKRNVADAFGLAGVDINQTEPADLTAPPTVRMERGNAEVEYGLVLAALSQMTLGEGLPPSQTLSLIQNVVDDFADGKIDNVGRNGGDLPNILTATPSHIIGGVQGASNDFLRGPRNASGINGAESPTYTQAQTPTQPYHPHPQPGGGGTTPWGAPTGVTALAGDASVTVSWNAVTGATSYNVYYSAVSGTGVGGTKVASAASPKAVTGLTNGVTYYFVVTAVNSTAESSASSQVSATPTAPPPGGQVCSSGCGSSGECSSHGGVNCSAGPDSDGSVICVDGWRDSSVQYSCNSSIPAAPTNVTATPGNASVTVSWDAVAGATSYNVYVSDIMSTTPFPTAGSPKTITGLANCFPYSFWVTAVNSNGESANSVEVFATPNGPCGGI